MNTSEPKIAVIIVNYNVAFFLEQCLNSVARAMRQEPAEVWVVDNNSVDGSVEMIAEKFPWVKLIANKDNRGFSRANNQAMELSDCNYQLLLNPDTVIEEDTLRKVVDYMDNHPDVGGLGVRMVDGKGIFLPESKRGLPTPLVAFCKIFGLSAIFPKSKLFGRYHLGYLSEFETHEIEILSGAFMLMRKEALDKTGLLDEDFFMYGEDIDLSYRILKGGYKNVYFPETRIIHYKGESTKKSSVNYVFVFYRAMVIFARKHFSQKNAALFSFLINAAIYFRAGLAIAARFIRQWTLPVIDFGYIITGLFALTHYWQLAQIDFPGKVTSVLILCYTAVWMFSVLMQGGYDRPVRLRKFFYGTLIGTAVILMVYALFPKQWQFSRLYILLGAGWTLVYYLLSRILLHVAVGKRFTINGGKNTSFAIVGSPAERRRMESILRNTQSRIDEIIPVGLDKNENPVATIDQLDQIVQVHDIDEVIFSAADVASADIIEWMITIRKDNLDYKIAQPDSDFLIGSNSIETAGDLYIMDINTLSHPETRRRKRMFDICIALLLLVASPVLAFMTKRPACFWKNIFGVLAGQKTLVGYSGEKHPHKRLPLLRRGILQPADRFSHVDQAMKQKLDLLYAREYSTLLDFRIVWVAWKELGTRC